MKTEPVRPQTGTIALYVDLFRDHARRAAERIAAVFRSAGFQVALCEDQDGELGLASHGASVANAVLLVTIGGDGTLLRAAQIAAPLRIPLFGINTGRLGFLTEMDGDPDGFDRLPALLQAGFSIDERSALQAELRGERFMALNDVVLRRASPHMTPFAIFVDGVEAANVPADGVVVATPTGSTAYSLSAGGPIVAPDVAALTISALLPHTLFSRPLVVRDSSRIEVACDEELQAVVLEADGQPVGELRPRERVLITRYGLPVRFARSAQLDFFRLLEGKLRWNAPVKDR